MKTILITGANSGLGRATAKALAAEGHHIVMLCRSRAKAEAAEQAIIKETGNDHVDLLIADLAVQADIRRAAQTVTERYARLDVLINNAGISVPERMETADGIERSLAVNHLAPFLLTHLLLDVLKAPARIINVATANFKRIHLDDLQWTERRYRPIPAYLQSKLGIVFFTVELAEKLAGSGITVNAVHPGVFQSNLGTSDSEANLINKLAAWSAQYLFPTADVAAERVVYLANSPEVEGVTGEYWGDREVLEAPKQAHDPQARQRLWQLSEQLTGLA